MKVQLADELAKLVGILARESDRGLVLAGAAMLDDALEALIRARMLDKQKIVDSLLDLDRPIGTFSSRIKVSYLLGLLEESEFRDLELIRKIRNECAHDRSEIDFRNAPHRDRIGELSAPSHAADLLHNYFEENFTDEGQLPRNQLLIAISFLSVWIIYRAQMINRSTVPDFSDMKDRAFAEAYRQTRAL